MGWVIALIAPALAILLILSNSPDNPIRQAGKAENDATTIEFSEFFDANASELKPSAKLPWEVVEYLH